MPFPAEEQDGENEHDAGGGHGADARGAGNHFAQALEIGPDAGTFRPIIGGITKFMGTDPIKITIGTAILAMAVHLDGSPEWRWRR